MDSDYPPDPTPSFQKPFSNEPELPVENFAAPYPVFTYKTPLNIVFCILCVVYTIVGTLVFIILFSIAISRDSKMFIYFSFMPLIFDLIAFIMGCCSTLYYSITVDQYQQIICIKSRKFSFCFNKKTIVQIGEIDNVIVQADHSITYKINNVSYNAFEINFQLRDGRNIRAISGVINKDNESQKAINILRNAFPQEVCFGGDLVNY